MTALRTYEVRFLDERGHVFHFTMSLASSPKAAVNNLARQSEFYQRLLDKDTKWEAVPV